MKKVYVFGALSSTTTGNPIVGYVQNLYKMITFANELRKEGFAVYAPGIDILYGIIAGDWTYRDYFDNNQPWMRSSDALCAVPGNWEHSTGAEREIASAERHGIPVFYTKEALIKWRDEEESK